MINVIDALWAQIEPIAFITREQFVHGLKEWDIETVEIGGELAFAALTKGPEFHFASFDTGAPITLRMIKARIDPLLDRYGFVTTMTPKDDSRQHRFNRTFGFKKVGESEFFLHFRLERRCQ